MSVKSWFASIAVSAVERVIKSATSALDNPEQWFVNLVGGGKTHSGVAVSPEGALKATAVMACVMVISQDVAKLPLKIYRLVQRQGRPAKLPATDHFAARLMRRPNEWQTGLLYRQVTQTHLLLRGNAYSFKVMNGRGEIEELIPIPPDCVHLYETADGERFYQVSLKSQFLQAQLNGAPMMIPAEFILHERGLSLDGITGISPIAYDREAVGLAIATEAHGARLFGNGAVPGGVLTYPGKLSDKAAESLRESWRKRHEGLGNAYKLAILEEGLKYQPIAMTGEDAQYLQTRQFQTVEICRIFRVPPTKIFDYTKMTLNNQEQISQQYVADTLMPWLEAREASYERELLSEDDQGTIIIEHDVDRLLRGDVNARHNAYSKGRQWGYYSVNDVREMENLPPIDNGDVYLQPLNMGPAGGNGDKGAAPSNTRTLPRAVGEN